MKLDKDNNGEIDVSPPSLVETADRSSSSSRQGLPSRQCTDNWAAPSCLQKDEFLQIPQIANNPLSGRMIAIFDEKRVACSRLHVHVENAHTFGLRAVVEGLSISKNSSPA